MCSIQSSRASEFAQERREARARTFDHIVRVVEPPTSVVVVDCIGIPVVGTRSNEECTSELTKRGYRPQLVASSKLKRVQCGSKGGEKAHHTWHNRCASEVALRGLRGGCARP
jgi:hypothetical protein